VRQKTPLWDEPELPAHGKHVVLRDALETREWNDARLFRHRLRFVRDDADRPLDAALRLRRRPDVCDGLGVRLFRERAPVVPVRECLPERCGDVGERSLVTARLEPRAGGLTPEPRVLGADGFRVPGHDARTRGQDNAKAREDQDQRPPERHSLALHARINSPTDATSSRICEWLTIWPP